MKKVRIMLAAIAVLSVVGVGLAFKAKGPQPFFVLSSNNACVLTTSLVLSATTLPTTDYVAIANATIVDPTSQGGVCNSIIYTLPED